MGGALMLVVVATVATIFRLPWPCLDVLLQLPPFPVAVTVKLVSDETAGVPDVVMVRVELIVVVLDPLTDAGEKDPVAPLGRPEMVSVALQFPPPPPWVI